MANYGFHPEALLEYADATIYLVHNRSPMVAESFVGAVESAITTITQAPDRWRIVDTPRIRRYVLRRFPYVLYYRWDAEENFVTIFAVMHYSREPGYWKSRIA